VYAARVPRRLRRALYVATAALVAGAFAACGARTTLSLSLSEPTGHAGGGGHGGSEPKHDAGPRDASPEAGSEAGPPDSGPSCLPDGVDSICEAPSECCSDMCNTDGFCGPFLCRKEGDLCKVDTDCCKMLCQQTPIAKQCLDCLLPGNACTDGGLACCYGTCDEAGYCAEPPCLPDGEPVLPELVKAECCSHHARYGYCSPPTCLSDKEPCVSLADCCSYACTFGRCGDGGVPCAPDGEPCAQLADCCSYDCNAAGTCGQAPCAADGQPCTAPSDCCSNSCDPTGTCAINQCSPDATACTAGAECCSGYCVLGFCNAQACLANGLHCTDPSQCCDGVCAINSVNKATCGGITVNL
jgi:hypothetical protein